jgi:hypothetical protein
MVQTIMHSDWVLLHQLQHWQELTLNFAAAVFAPILFRKSTITPVAQRDFLLHFIS